MRQRRNIIEASPKISYLAADNVFDRLVPFWQLHLYLRGTANPISMPT